MIEMAAELRELRGIPAAIQETFDDQCSEAKGIARARAGTVADIITMEGPA